MAPTVKDIYIYPVKSCRGIRLESAVITNTGPVGFGLGLLRVATATPP